ncbi:MAG: GNAT family N-acetyltransferase [Shinella sp.]|nr:GNAT family N-acetyltransferase [Shinella sp.]
MITIRHAREDDILPLTDIGMRAWEQAVAEVADLDALRENARNAFLVFLANQWVSVVVAEKDGIAAGWAAREELDDQITDLWVDPSRQRIGVGAALLDAVEQEILAADYEISGLQTHARNAPALAFFGKHGYSVRWLSVAYSPKLDRDVESVGLHRRLVADEPVGYGPGGF